MRIFPPYFYFWFARNQLFLASREQTKGLALPARTCVLLGPTGFAFRPSRPQKSYPKFRLGPSGLAICSFMPFPQKHNPNVGSALRALFIEHRKCPIPHFFACSMSTSRSQTCRSRLLPRRVWLLKSCITSTIENQRCSPNSRKFCCSQSN